MVHSRVHREACTQGGSLPRYTRRHVPRGVYPAYTTLYIPWAIHHCYPPGLYTTVTHLGYTHPMVHPGLYPPYGTPWAIHHPVIPTWAIHHPVIPTRAIPHPVVNPGYTTPYGQPGLYTPYTPTRAIHPYTPTRARGESVKGRLSTLRERGRGREG